MKRLLLVMAISLAAALALPPSHAQDKAAASAAQGNAAAAPRYPAATLTVFNRPIVTFHHALLGLPPAERIAVAREHIYAILETGGDDKVTTESIDLGRLVKIGARPAFIIATEDVPPGSGETLDTAAQDAVAALTHAIAETRESRDSRLMVRAVIVSGIATAVYLLVLWGLIQLGRWITQRMLRVAGETSARIKVGGAEFLQRHRALRLVATLLRVAGWFLILLVTYEWLGFVLSRFPYTRVWGEHLNGFLIHSVLDILAAIAESIPELFIAIVIFVIARGADRMQRSFMNGVESGRVHVGWVDKDTAPATRRLFSLAIWLFAVVMAYPYIPGSSTDAFKGVGVLLGLMVSVGASGIVGQAASGLILMYTRTFRTGDYVRIGDAEGTVTKMGVFTTHVNSGLGEDLSIPNATVLGMVTRNFSHAAPGAGFMLEANVTIGYDAPWRQVRAMLLDAAHATSEVADTPEARVLVTKLSDFYVEYSLVCYARPTGANARADVISALYAAIIDAFNTHGVQIMSPHYFGDPTHPKVVAREHWYAPPAKPPEG
jgi:small-conductance mechanosensitive channel